MEEMEVDSPSIVMRLESYSSGEQIISERLAASHIYSESSYFDETALSKLDTTRFIRDSNSTLTDFFDTEQRLDVMEHIFTYLDSNSLLAARLVCREWEKVISQGNFWKKLVERNVRSDALWRGIAERRGWIKKLSEPRSDPTFYRKLFPQVSKEIKNLENNWLKGTYNLQRIESRSVDRPGVYCLQYDNQKIVTGSRDGNVKIWDRQTLECVKVLTGHRASVLCLQFDEKINISGSSDCIVLVWDVNSGELINTLTHHGDNLTQVKFLNDILVTCSKDRTIAVWYMPSPTDIQLRNMLVGHRAAVNAVDLDEKYIVSASGDRTMKVWNTSTCGFVRDMKGHDRGIACLQYLYPLVVTGSSDNTIRIWNVETGACLRILEGHEGIVRCIRFNSKYIISGDYEGKIKVWDLLGALDLEKNSKSLCLHTLRKHTERVYRLQFDDMQIVSSSHDDNILIWDFLDYNECAMVS